MNKKILLLLGLVVPFAVTSSFAQNACDKECLTRGVLKAATVAKGTLERLPSYAFMLEAKKFLANEHPNAEQIVNMGKIYRNEVTSVSLPNETFTDYLFIVWEKGRVHHYTVTEYQRQTRDNAEFNGAELLKTYEIDKSYSADVYISLLGNKIAQLTSELESFGLDKNYMPKLLRSASDILRITRIVSVHKDNEGVLKDVNKQKYTGHVEVEYVSGNREKFNFTCIPAGTTLDDEHTITNDDFPMGILTAVKLVMPILNEEK